MNLRTVVALAATCAIAIGACNKKDEAPATPTGEAAPAAAGDEAAAPAGDEAAADEAPGDEAPADEAAADEAPADEAVADDAAPAAAGGDAMKKAMALQRKALELLKANKDDPAAAAAALEKLHEERKDEIAAIQAEFAAMSAKFKDDPSAAMAMMGEHMAEIQELTKLTTDLLSEAPELMASPGVAAAMGKLSPDMGGDDEAGEVDEHAGHDHGDGDHEGHDHGDEAAADGPKLSDEDKALLDEMLVAQEKMVEILSTHASDPDKAGEELMAYATDKSESLAKFQGVQQRLQGDQAAAMEFAQKHMPRIAALGQKLSEIVQANPELLTNEKVQAAMAKMNGGQ